MPELDESETILKGKYTYIGVDIDTTGRRILDEVSLLPRVSSRNHVCLNQHNGTIR